MKQQQKLYIKSIPALLLLLLFSYNVLFCHISLWLWKAYMNEQIEEFAKLLPNTSLEKISLPFTGGIQHEIENNGEMYDVIRYERQGAIINYFCVKDFTENILSLMQDEGLSAKSDLAKKQWTGHAKQLQKNGVAKYLITDFCCALCLTPYIQLYTVRTNISILETTIVITSPPPDQELV